MIMIVIVDAITKEQFEECEDISHYLAFVFPNFYVELIIIATDS